MRIRFAGILVTLCLGLAPLAATAKVAPRPAAPRARNIILFIADGCGFNSLEAASYFEHGRTGQQVYDQEGWVRYACQTSPLTRSSTTQPVQDRDLLYDAGKTWDKGFERVKHGGTGAFKGYNYLKDAPTDSAAAASALATGQKTYNGAISYVDTPDGGKALMRQTIAEIAFSRGKAAGVITSVPLCHATPAALGGSHNDGRGNYAEIANELLNARHLSVLMGGGHPLFDASGAPRMPQEENDFQFVGGPDTWQKLVAGDHPGGWALVQTRDQFASLVTGRTPRRVLGVAQVAQTLQQQRRTREWTGDGYVDRDDYKAAPAFGDPPVPTVPTLATMTQAAINVLDNASDGRGFYLMVEGGAVDWANHNNEGGRMIEEAVAFHAAIRAAAEWVEKNGGWDHTLVIITADHETGMLWGPDSDLEPFQKIQNNGAGNMPGLRYHSGGHTRSLVPLFARGPGSERFEKRVIGFDPKYGAYVDNTDVFDIMRLELTPPAARRARK